MKEARLEGEKAVQAIQCYTMLNVFNNVLGGFMKAIIEDAASEEEAKKQGLTLGQYVSTALITKIEEIAGQLNEDFDKLTEMSANSYKVVFEQQPIILIEEINMKEEV